MASDPLPSHIDVDHELYVPDWVFFGDPPRMTDAERLAAYQVDQHDQFTAASRAAYERNKALSK